MLVRDVVFVLALGLTCSCRGQKTTAARPSADAALAPASAAVPSAKAPQVDADRGVRDQSDCPAGMVFIPVGTFSMTAPVLGSEDETPRLQTFQIAPFCIDRTEVSVHAYEGAKAKCGREHGFCDAHYLADAPATCLTHGQAECFCASAAPGVKKRLPTDVEWLYAALGSDGRRYPWGNSPYPEGLQAAAANFCSFEAGRPVQEMVCPVEQNSLDRSPFGVIGMATNGYEMTDTCMDTARTGPACVVRGAQHSVSMVDVIDRRFLMDRGSNAGRGPNVGIGFRCATSERAQP